MVAEMKTEFTIEDIDKYGKVNSLMFSRRCNRYYPARISYDIRSTKKRKECRMATSYFNSTEIIRVIDEKNKNPFGTLPMHIRSRKEFAVHIKNIIDIVNGEVNRCKKAKKLFT
jgi:hypothetical protein